MIISTTIAEQIDKAIEDYNFKLYKFGGLKGCDELYKWELLTKFQLKSDSSVGNYADQVAKIKFKNLMYPSSVSVIHRLCDVANTDYNNLLSTLFTGTNSINERIANFCNSVKALYTNHKPVGGEEFKDFHDERTAAALLTFYDPHRYTFFMPTFYKNLCSELNIKTQDRNNRYEHYMSLIYEISVLMRSNKQITNLIKSETTTLIQSRLLSAQDLVFQCFYRSNESYYIDEQEQATQIEGRGVVVSSVRYERNRAARTLCIKQKGCKCIVCGFDFEKQYGKELGAGFIHVHHIVPISERQGEYKLDVKKDLVPVCPNCHAMLHKEVDGRYLSPNELSKIIMR